MRSSLDAYTLIHDGAIALAQVESNGICIDVPYLDRAIVDIGDEITVAEENIRADPLFATWKKEYGVKTTLGSYEQIVHVLDKAGHYSSSETTATGRKKADKATLADIDVPLAKKFLRRQSLTKVRSTYLEGLRREVCNGYLHPSFNLHTTLTFRSSSTAPNFQNIPIRDPEQGSYIRRAFIPRNDYIGEIDFKGIEVSVAYCYHKDPNMREYLLDKSKDMHRDMAMQIYGITDKSQVTKGIRNTAKAAFVFAQFYGDYYPHCAKNLWKAVDEKTTDGTPVRKLLKAVGVRELGPCIGGRDYTPEKGTFEYRIKEIETHFWGTRFPGYAQWKKDWYEAYRKKGGFRTLTGFWIEGIYRRNEAVNYPIQGSAFHCLLWSLIRLQRWLVKHRMKTVIVGQIHDSIVLDFAEDEIQDVLTMAKQITTIDLLNAWKWIITPLETEVEIAPKGKSWHLKKSWVCRDGVWGPEKG